MLCMVITMAPAMAWAGEGDPETPEAGSNTSAVTLNIADGSIKITDTGYTQGEAETETAWDTSNSSHELTISGTSTANQIIVEGGNPVITLKDLTMSNVGVAIDLKADAKICLQGNNTLTPKEEYPGIYIAKDHTLTVAEESTGTLTIKTNKNTAGIGTSNSKGGYMAGGTVEINGGTIMFKLGSKNNNGSSLGAGFNGSMEKVAINGGVVKFQENNEKAFYAIRAKEIEVTGGTVDGTKYGGGYGDTSCTVKVTGGNINSFSGEIAGRTRTELYFVNEETGEIAANTEVTVEENGYKWTALTDAKGRITTYLGNTTTSIQAAIGAASLKNVVIHDGERKILIGAECTCEETPGTLSISADKNELLISDDSQKVKLSAAYTNENCNAPDTFHGEYEKISFEVLRVEKNGKYVNKDTYTSITGNVLSVYYNEDGDDYTVYVRAFSGVEDHEAYSDAKAITVHNFVPSDTLDIGKGTITITGTGYKQGTAETETSWDTSNSSHELTITGTSTTNRIIVEGGTPVITLKDLTMSNVEVAIDLKADAKICLQGNNTLTPKEEYPGIYIAKDHTLTVAEESTGTLTIKTNKNTAGIGTSNSKGGYMAGGTVEINGGTIMFKLGSKNNNGSSLGAGFNGSMEKVAINGGVVKFQENNEKAFYAIRAKEIEVTGGTVDGTKYGGGYGDTSCTVKVTGGNINSFSGEIAGRTRTELYFVNKDGTPLANTEVRVSESGTNTWKAHTNEKGVVTTYLASGTKNITVSYGEATNETVTLASDVHKYLIGGECTCDSIKGITWNHGLPASVNMYDAEDSIYTVANAVIETTEPCNMPIHPNLPGISYELSVNKGGNEVSENANEYASLNNGSLTLKPANAPYTVTLTAKAGIGDAEKTATHTIEVNKNTAAEKTTVINLSKGNVVINYADGAYSYTQGESTDVNASSNILLTGNKKAATVTVNGGSPQFTFNQNTPDNVWKVFAGESAEAISLDLSGVSGKVRFGLDGLKDGQLSYITSEAVKLNPKNGSITFNADGSVTQGKFTITGINGAKVSVIGASKEEVTTVTNNTGEALTLKINGRDVTLAAGGSYTVKRAVSSYDVSADGEIWAYVLESDQPLYKYNINTSGAAGTQYAPENRDEYIAIYGLSAYASDLEQETVQGYELITAGEGTVKGMGKNDNCESEELDFRDGIMRVYLDPEITKLSGGFFYAMNALDEVDMYYLKSMSGDLWGAGIRKLNIGPYLDGSGVAVNFMRYLRSITVDEANPSFMTDDGVLYSKDGKTLMQCPTWKKGNYKILDACETIGANAFYGTHLNVLTINAKLSSIANTRTFEAENNLYIKVAYGNQYFSAVNGALYTADGKKLIKLPYGAVKANGGEFVIPEGVTSVADYGIQNNYLLKKLTLPSTLSSQGGNFMVSCGVIEELIVNTSWVGVDHPDSKVLRKVTVIEDYPFSTTNMFNKTSMSWVKGNITVSAEDCLYDGKAHSVKVTSNGNTVEYSDDGTAWSTEAPEYTQPGTYTVYWRVTKAAGDDYAFAREVYSQKTFTISEIEASEDWFALNPLGTTDSTESPVTLSQPAGSPSLLEDGYTVLYSKKDGSGEPTADFPTEVGEYIVTVKITADGYIEDTLTLGVYTVRENEVAEGEVVLSFVTNGGSYISPIIGGKGNAISVTVKTEKTGYTFAGWYSDSALRTNATIPTTMPDADATYYAKWTRNEYSITYNYNAGSDRVTADNPSTYNVETPTFTLKAPVRAGYTFLGWKENGEGEPLTIVTIEKGVTVGNKAYTAVWEATSYTITENGDGSVTITEGQTTTTITPPAGGKVVVGDDGVITAPAGTEIVKTEDDGQGNPTTTTTVTLPSGGTVDANNKTVSSEKGSVITENPDGTVTIVNGENTTTVTPPAGETITVSEGEVILPAGSTVEQSENGQTTTTKVPDSVASITVPSGIIDEVAGDEGNISLPGGTVVTGKGDNAGSATIPDTVGSVTVPENNLGGITADDNGAVNLPEGTVITNGKGNNQTVITVPEGGQVNGKGTASSETGSVITENTNGTVTVTDKSGNTTTIKPSGDEKITVSTDGKITVPSGSTVNGVEIPESTDSVTIPADKVGQVEEKDGALSLPSGSTVTTDGKDTVLGNGGTITEEGTVNENPSSGGGIYIPTEKPATDPTQSGNTTTTDMSGSTVSKGGQTTTTVDKQVADKLVETAVKNNSEEIVINAVTKNQSAASSTKASEVTLPAETLQTIADKTNADIVIKTNVAEIKLDNKAAEAVASQAQTGTVTVVAEKVKEDANEVHFELKVVSSSGEVISDFNGGNVAVTVNVPDSLKGKKMVCVYIDGDGYWHKVPGELNANGTYTFTTEHFSTYAIMSEEEADAAIAEQQAKIKKIIKGVEATTLKARSSKTSKGIKITWTKSKGYKVDYYVIYRSTKKNSGYGTKPFYTTKSATAGYYVNSKDLKKGTKYYYKVRGVRVIDGQKYYTEYSTTASRTW